MGGEVFLKRPPRRVESSGRDVGDFDTFDPEDDAMVTGAGAKPREGRRGGDEPKEGAGLESRIQSAASLAELRQIILAAGEIPRDRKEGNYTSEDVDQQIGEFERFLTENLDPLLMSVITGRKDNRNDLLLEKIINIPRGLGIRQKVRDLMAERWNQRFQDNKKELMEKSVASVTSLDELYKIIRQFRSIHHNGRDYLRENGDLEAVIRNIEKAKENLHRQTKDWPEVDINRINQATESVLRAAEIPTESGISNKAHQLICKSVSEAIKERKLGSYSDELNQPLFKRWAGKAKRFFSRQK